VVEVRERRTSNEERNNVSILHKMWTSNGSGVRISVPIRRATPQTLAQEYI